MKQEKQKLRRGKCPNTKLKNSCVKCYSASKLGIRIYDVPWSKFR